LKLEEINELSKPIFQQFYEELNKNENSNIIVSKFQEFQKKIFFQNFKKNRIFQSQSVQENSKMILSKN